MYFTVLLNIAMSQVILNESGVRSLIGKGKSAAVPEHMRMSAQGQGSRAVLLQQQIDRGAVQRPALLADKECLHRGRSFHAGPLLQPGGDRPQFVGAKRMVRR